MRFRLLAFMLAFSLFSVSATAQFRHTIGVRSVLGIGKTLSGMESYDGTQHTYGAWGVHYYPRLTFGESGSLSVGIPLTVGLSGSYNSRVGGDLSFLADIPLTVDFNFGAGASEESESNFGGFVGAGFGYTFTSFEYEYYSPYSWDVVETLKGSSYGPVVHGGVRFNLWSKTFTPRGFYKYRLEKARFSTFGASFGIDL